LPPPHPNPLLREERGKSRNYLLSEGGRFTSDAKRYQKAQALDSELSLTD